MPEPTTLGPNGGKLVELPAGAIFVAGGTTVQTTDTFTRVADTNAYAVGDSIGATVSDSGTTALRGIAVAGAATTPGGTGYITGVELWTDQIACVAAIRVRLFTVAAPTTAVPGDNVAGILSVGNFAQEIGWIDLPVFAPEAGTNTAVRTRDITTRLPFACAVADTKLYYRLQTQTAFTPASAQGFWLRLSTERNAT